MSFQQEFTASLESGAPFPALWDVVLRHKAAGMTPQEIYDKLHIIWLSHGYDDEPNDSRIRNELEQVMEKTWFERPIETVEDSIAH